MFPCTNKYHAEKLRKTVRFKIKPTYFSKFYFNNKYQIMTETILKT